MSFPLSGTNKYTKLVQLWSTNHSSKRKQEFNIYIFLPTRCWWLLLFELSQIQQKSNTIKNDLDYFISTYIDEYALFLPIIWVEISSSLQRNTNACESIHSTKWQMVAAWQIFFFFIRNINQVFLAVAVSSKMDQWASKMD